MRWRRPEQHLRSRRAPDPRGACARHAGGSSRSTRPARARRRGCGRARSRPLAFEDHVVDAGLRGGSAEQQARGAGADDGDLGAHEEGLDGIDGVKRRAAGLAQTAVRPASVRTSEPIVRSAHTACGPGAMRAVETSHGHERHRARRPDRGPGQGPGRAGKLRHRAPAPEHHAGRATRGLSRAAARRHLLTLADLGYRRAMAGISGCPRVLRLSGAYLSSARLPRLLQPTLDRLAHQTQAAFSAVVRDGDEVVIVANAGRASARGRAARRACWPRACTWARACRPSPPHRPVLLADLPGRSWPQWLRGRCRPGSRCGRHHPSRLAAILRGVRRQDACLASEEHEGWACMRWPCRCATAGAGAGGAQCRVAGRLPAAAAGRWRAGCRRCGRPARELRPLLWARRAAVGLRRGSGAASGRQPNSRRNPPRCGHAPRPGGRETLGAGSRTHPRARCSGWM